MVQLSHSYVTGGKTKAWTALNFGAQSDDSAFPCTVLVCHSFSAKVKVSFKFMAAITAHSDFGAQENEI